MTAAETLLSGCIDYAGLFPPASHDLATTLVEYERYREGEDAWALGRLVLPAGSVAGFRAHLSTGASDWPVSLLLGPEWENDIRLAEQLGVRLDTIEFKPTDVHQIAAVRGLLPNQTKMFFEIPHGAAAAGYLSAIADVGACAKIRTGGVTAGAIPTALEVAGFLACCAQHRVALKATAGLHHALRAIHPLTYEAHSDRAPMHGFVNVILAASMLQGGGDPQQAATLIEDDCPTNFLVNSEGVSWCDVNFTTGTLAETRETFLLSFGSCSFTEPIAELRQMRWM